MRCHTPFLIVPLLLLVPRLLSGADAAPSLRDALSPEEFRRAGLHKLSPSELAFLSQRLLPPTEESPDLPPANVVASIPSPEEEPARVISAPATDVGEAAFGREQQIREEAVTAHRVPKTMTSRLAGNFRGWDGQTVFHLENGQVWRQADSTTFQVNVESPVVKIEQGTLGAYYLSIAGYHSRVRVRRVR